MANTLSWPVKKKIGQHVELAGKKNELEANTLSWLVKIYMKSKIADVPPLTGSINCFLSLSIGSGILLWHGWLLCGRRLLVL